MSLWSTSSLVQGMTDVERLELRYEAEDMFYHAYNAYMSNAWPADELMPLSCRGRFRGREPNRGDIDDAMGNFSLTLIDSLDMLVVLGDLEEFEASVKKVINTVSFDSDIVVSVFETNIRIVGGLLSGHVLAELVQAKQKGMSWYRGELLNMAIDCGTRLLPAFNSTTGLPYPRVNLKTGLQGVNSIQLTCTACAGSMILEFAALSRLSGEKIFEEKASKAMDVLWSARHRQSNLVGNVLNVNTGDWVRRDSGVGAGIDSYYEYVAKAYVLLGEDKYLERWNSHYSAVMKYLGSGPLMMDVHMHRPTTNSKHFVDALGAFWPGLQVLMGDLKPAIEQHEVLYQIMKRHNFLPEAVTADFQVHWGQHLLRPEFVESTYFLYKATQDPYYLEVGKKVLKSLQKHARVTCGYAAVKDVRTLQHEDRMDSFVITETFKYLYLLFAKEEDMFLDISQFVFTTEAHLLPLTLARLSNSTAVPVSDDFFYDEDEDVEYEMACPSTRYMFPGHDTLAGAASLRKPLESLVEDSCPTKRILKRKLTAPEFQSTSEEHLKLVRDMGITIITLPDGRVQLLHTFANAKTPEDGEEGLMFMQEMIDLSRQQSTNTESPPKLVSFKIDGQRHQLQAGPAQFGKDLKNGLKVTGKVVMANHVRGCGGSLQNGESMWGKIVIVERGDCMFVEKARVLQSLGAIGGIVMDNTDGTAAASSPLFAMSGDGVDDIKIPMVFLFMKESMKLMEILQEVNELEVTLEEKPEGSDSDFVSSADGDLDEDKDDEGTDKLKSAVHAFLEKNLNVADPQLDPNRAETIYVQMDNETGEIISQKTHTIRSPDGSSRTIKTIEKIKNGEIETENRVGQAKLMKIEEMMNIEDVDEDTIEKSFSVPNVIGDINNSEKDLKELEGKVIDDLVFGVDDPKVSEKSSQEVPNFGNMISFLKPASEAVKKLIDETTLRNPQVIQELLSIDFRDLLKVFQKIFSKSKSIEEAYRTLFEGVSQFGAAQFIENIYKTQKSKDNKKDLQTEEIINKFVSTMTADGGNIADMLGTEKLNELVGEYIKNMEFESLEQNDKVTATMDKILQDLKDSTLNTKSKIAP